MTLKPVLIAGAGIGGLASALFLARKGIPVVVAERRTTLMETGAGVQLSPNASRILLDLGFGPALMRQAVEPKRVVIRDAASGEPISTVALGDHMTTRHDAPYLVIQRSDLHMLLLDIVRSMPNVRLLIGRGITGAKQTADGVDVEMQTESGTIERIQTPCLIGADGFRSVVRGAMGDARTPRFTGFEAWRAVLPIEAVPALETLEPETGLWLSRRLHLVHYPLAGGKLVNVVAVVPATQTRTGWSSTGDEHAIEHHAAHACETVQRLIGAVEQWNVWSLYTLPVQRMISGRIALVGDAAHPIVPFLAQGAAMAVEDAATLAETLATANGNIASVLPGYERIRRRRVARVQKAAMSLGRAYHAGPLKALARNAVLRHLGPTGLANRYDWLYGWRLKVE